MLGALVILTHTNVNRVGWWVPAGLRELALKEVSPVEKALAEFARKCARQLSLDRFVPKVGTRLDCFIEVGGHSNEIGTVASV
jgi:hypothetical protein